MQVDFSYICYFIIQINNFILMLGIFDLWSLILIMMVCHLKSKGDRQFLNVFNDFEIICAMDTFSGNIPAIIAKLTHHV